MIPLIPMTSTGHPDARYGRIYTDAYSEAIRVGLSQADARDHATQAVERAEREVAA